MRVLGFVCAGALSLVLAACAAGLSPDGSPARTPAVLAVDTSGPVIPTAATWIGAAPSQTVIVTGADTPMVLGIWIDAPRAVRQGPRAPLSLSLVVDGSGSMSGEKIDHAHLAAISLLESLGRGDIVSMASFSDAVTEIAPPTEVEPDTIGELIAQVRDIQALGSTNLHDGLLLGTRNAGSAPHTHPVRRVLVISDGQANVGPSTPEALGDVAARGTEAGVQVSAIGVGLDYDERTLGALAARSSGRLYHLEQPSQMAAILDQEVRLLSATAAAGAYLEIVPAEGVEVLGAAMIDGRDVGGAFRMGLGTLYAGQHRELLVRVKVRGGAATRRELATARLFYRQRWDQPERQMQEVSLRADVTDDSEAAARSAEPRVRAMLARHEAAEAQRKAAALLNQGQHHAAADVLEQAQQDLSMTAAETPIAEEQQALSAQAATIGRVKDKARKATTRQAQQSTAKEGYGYSFADDGLAAPKPSPSLRPPVR